MPGARALSLPIAWTPAACCNLIVPRALAAPPPPRLFVIMAAEAHVAVVIRRGPSSWAHITAWDTARDAFTPGAWFRGRIFAEKCDLSPDGELFLYAAYKGGRLGVPTTDSWTAISRLPWLHALALWPMGTTYGGGGRFVGPRQLVLRGVLGPHPAAAKAHDAESGIAVVDGVAELHRSSGEVEGAEWSGRDQRGRLVYAMHGRLYARKRSATEEDVELADFNAHEPQTAPPPAWATRPLARVARRSTRH